MDKKYPQIITNKINKNYNEKRCGLMIKKKKFWISMISVLSICVMVCGSSMATSTYSTAHINGGTSATSGVVGLSSKVETWGINGVGSKGTLTLKVHNAPAGSDFSVVQTRTASPNVTLNKTNSPSKSSTSSWKIKVTGTATLYSTSYVQCVD